MYEVGDLIVYGRTGICEVTEITTLKMDGVPKRYSMTAQLSEGKVLPKPEKV